MDGNAEQLRLIAAQSAEAALLQFAAQHPELKRKEVAIPAPLKWAGGIAAAVFTAGIAAFFLWLTSTVNDMQLTLARMDERLSGQAEVKTARDDDQDRRLGRLEGYHGLEGGP